MLIIIFNASWVVHTCRTTVTKQNIISICRDHLKAHTHCNSLTLSKTTKTTTSNLSRFYCKLLKHGKCFCTLSFQVNLGYLDASIFLFDLF